MIGRSFNNHIFGFSILLAKISFRILYRIDQCTNNLKLILSESVQTFSSSLTLKLVFLKTFRVTRGRAAVAVTLESVTILLKQVGSPAEEEK